MKKTALHIGPMLPLLLALLSGVGCEGSAIPVPLPDGFDVPATAVDVVVDLGPDQEEPEDAGDVAAPCSCLPEDPCTATDPSCAPEGCAEDADCDDGDPCTQDFCAPATDLCEHFELPGCCLADSECDDEIACTVDTCEDNDCVNTPQAGCCFADAECADAYETTTDLCLDHVCYAVFDEPLACESDGDCIADNGNDCYGATCRQGTCSYTPSGADGCCGQHADCADGDVCTVDVCRSFRCVYVLSTEPEAQLDEDFDDREVNGLVLMGSVGELAWSFTSDRAVSAPYALRYGRPTGGYGGATAFEAVAQTDWLRLPETGAATLSFASFVEIAESGDEIRIDAVSVAGGTVTLWTPEAGTTGWTEEEVDLSPLGGAQIRLRFVFASDGAADPSLEGWTLDDVQAVFRCLPPQ